MSNRLWENKENMKDKEGVLIAVSTIVAAYLRRNEMDPAAVGSFIHSVFASVCNLQNATTVRPQKAPVDIDKSVTPDYLICLESGKSMKMLKRHLRTTYGMTPEQYRERWDLPADYPMVAPNYAKKRSALAKNNGLGLARRGSASNQDIAAPSVGAA
jgi:predicted transcriptional regulator